MPRESSVSAAEKMLRAIRLVNDLATEGAQDRGEPAGIPLDAFARMLGLSPAETERVIRKINLGCGDSLPELLVDYDPDARTVTPRTVGVAFERPLRLSPAEARALLAVIDASGIADGRRLAEKIEGAFPPIEPTRFKTVQNAARTKGLGPLLQTFTAAVGERHAVRLRYRGASDPDARERVVEPYAVTYDAEEGMWYLGAWCRAADGWRTFRLDRIEQADDIGETFDARERVGTAPFGLDGVDDAPLAMLAVHDPSSVVDVEAWRGLMRVESPLPWDARRLTDDDLVRGGYLAAIPWVQGSDWLARMVAQTFGGVEAVRPAELRAEVARTARALRKRLQS